MKVELQQAQREAWLELVAVGSSRKERTRSSPPVRLQPFYKQFRVVDFTITQQELFLQFLEKKFDFFSTFKNLFSAFWLTVRLWPSLHLIQTTLWWI